MNDTGMKDATNMVPRTFNGDLTALPTALRLLSEKNQWVLWLWAQVASGKWTKPPVQARSPDRRAKNNDPATWSSLAEAVHAVQEGLSHGIGFVLTGTEIAAIDFDHCRDPETGAIDAWAQAIIDQASDAYIEVTVSGSGLRVIGTATGEATHTRYKVAGQNGAGIELYRRAVRYITVSGLQINKCDTLPNIDALIDNLAAEHGSRKPDTATQANFEFSKRGINDLIRNGAPETHRSEAFQSAIWRLANCGHTVDEIEEILAAHPNGIAKKYQGRLRKEIERSYDKWKAAGGIASVFDPETPDDQDNSGSRPAVETRVDPHDWNDPDLSLLDDRRGELPDFPIDVLTAKWQGWIELAARGAGVTPAHVAVPLIGIASALIGTARRVQASQSWSQPMTLWAALVGASGTGKTPGIDATKRALAWMDRLRKEKIAKLALEHQTKAEAASAQRKLWKKEVEEATAENRPAPPMPASAADPGAFVAPRLYVSDATIERMAVLLQANPRGMLRLSDELSGLFLNMSRYSGGQDNEFWLEAWNGNPYLVERMGRPPISVEYLLVGVVGGLQPDKLSKSFIADMDGMYARMLFSWPPEPNYQPLTDDVTEFEPEVINALSRLIKLPCGEEFTPKMLPLSSDARTRFEQLRQFVHATKVQFDGREREWFAKVPAHVLRLSGTLCFLDWAIKDDGLPEPEHIDEIFMSAACRLVCEYLWLHSRAALRQIGLSERHANSRRVLRWIKATGKTEVSIKDIRRHALVGALDADQTESLVEELMRSGWLCPEAVKPSGPKGGKPVRRWQVNPLLWAAETAETAETSTHDLYPEVSAVFAVSAPEHPG
jgi:hypothetical protein